MSEVYVRLPELIRTYVPVSRATIWRWVKSGAFPQPVKLGDRVTAWNVEEVKKWIENKR